MTTVSEQLDGLLKQRAAKIAAMQDLMDACMKQGRVFEPDEETAYDQLEGETKKIDSHVGRLQTLEQTIARTASPIIQMQGGSRNKPLAKGRGFARIAQLIASSGGNDMLAERIAKQTFPDMPDLARIFEGRAMGIISRAATTAATTADPAWLGVLAYAQQLSGEIIELVKAESILGQLSLRQVPFNVRIVRETTAIGSAGWVGQGMSKPVGKGAYDFVTVPPTKAALILLLTEECARYSEPSAEGLMSDGLVQAIAGFLDSQFIGAAAPVSGVSPGGILNALPVGQTFASAGNTVEGMAYDLAHAVAILNTPNAARSPAWIMSPQNLIAIQTKTNAFGQPAFPSASQGRIGGYPVASSAYVPNDVIVLLDQAQILHASDSTVAIDTSREASVQMDTAPTTPPTSPVSLWQQNMIGLRAEKFEYWLRARDTAVVSITGVDYGAAPEPIIPGLAASTSRSKSKD